MSNLIGSGINQIPTNGMLGNMAFQDKAYVSIDKVGIGSTFVDSGTSGQILQVYGGGAYIDGNTGIGSTNPSSKLSVVGNVSVSGVVTASSFSGNASVTQLQSTGISTFTNGPVLIGSGTSTGTATQRLQVTGGAYVSSSLGIGTTNPGNYVLDVNGVGRIGGVGRVFFGIGVGVGDYGLSIVPYSNRTEIQSEEQGVSYRPLVLQLSGSNVGIGTTNPGAKLQVQGDVNISGIATASQLDLTANATVDDSILYLSGTPYSTGAGSKNGVLGIGQLGFKDTNILSNFAYGADSYVQMILQNTNNTASASADFIVNNNQSTGTTIYGDFGINATAYAGGGPFGDGDGTYLYAAGGSLAVGTNDAKTFRIATGSASNTPVTRMTIVSGATTSIGIGVTNPGSTLHVVPSSTSIAGLFSGSTSGDMVRITQTGSGNALVVEDSTNPDASPFIVDATGDVGIGTVSPTAKLHIGAATTSAASNAPIKIDSGGTTNLLATPEVGTFEYDGSYFYNTPNSTSGRAYIAPMYSYRLTGAATTIGPAITDFFPASSSINLKASSVYNIKIFAYYTRNVANSTSTWTHVFSSAPTVFTASLRYSPVTGIANGTQTFVLSYSGGQAQTSMAHAATANITAATNNFAYFDCQVVTNAATNYRLRLTASSTGTSTPLAGSFYTVEEVATSTGSFAA